MNIMTGGSIATSSGVDLSGALSGGYHFAWMVCAGMVVVTLAAATVILRDTPSQARQVLFEAPCVECEAAA